MLRVDIYLFNDMQGGWVIYSNLFLFLFIFIFFHSGLGRGRSLLNFPTDQKVSAFCFLFFSFANKRRSAVYRVGTRDRMQMISQRLTKCVDSFDPPPPSNGTIQRAKIYQEFLVATGFLILLFDHI